MNREKAIRLKYYDILINGNITYDVGQVSIWDEKPEDTTNNLYILLKAQTAQSDPNYCMKTWTCTQEIVIVNKQPDTISKDTTDDICEKIEDLLYAALRQGAEYGGWQITNFVLDSVDYAAYILGQTDSELEKTLIFRQTVNKL
jgi:hypothetical protein